MIFMVRGKTADESLISDRYPPEPQVVNEPVFILSKVQRKPPPALPEGYIKKDSEGRACGYGDNAQNIPVTGEPENLFFQGRIGSCVDLFAIPPPPFFRLPVIHDPSL
jgi:hypothetical protein